MSEPFTKLEKLSSLADGELPLAEQAAIFKAWRADPELRSRWHSYQLIGDVLRSADTARTLQHDESFLRELRQSLATEPTVLAPQASPSSSSTAHGIATVAASSSSQQGWLWPALSLGVVACVAFSAGAFFTQLTPWQELRQQGGAWVQAANNTVSSWANSQSFQLSGSVPATSADTRWVDSPRHQFDGYQQAHMQFVRDVVIATSLEQEGWFLRDEVAGFHQVDCVKRYLQTSQSLQAAAQSAQAVQAVFSNGVEHVSIFLEPFEPQRHEKEAIHTSGATTILARQHGNFWVTVVGEAPGKTVEAFSQALERKKQHANQN